MAHHITLTTTRTTTPDPVALLAAIKTATGDPTAVLITFDGITATGKKATDWTPAQIADAQTLLDTAPPMTAQLTAQREIDRFPIALWSVVLALIDETNRLRAALRGLGVANLPDVTIPQVKKAIRDKAATLNGG